MEVQRKPLDVSLKGIRCDAKLDIVLKGVKDLCDRADRLTQRVDAFAEFKKEGWFRDGR